MQICEHCGVEVKKAKTVTGGWRHADTGSLWCRKTMASPKPNAWGQAIVDDSKAKGTDISADEF